MKVLVIALARNGEVNQNLANVVTAASKINATCDVLVIGNTNKVPAQYTGVANVLQVRVDGHILSVEVAASIAQFAKAYTHVVMAADSSGKDLLPRVAGILDVGQISDVLAICSPNIFKKPMYAGNIIAEVESFDDIKLLSVRPTSFLPAPISEIPVIVHNLEIDSSTNTKFISENIIETKTVGLAQAKVIVSGGRSLGSQESFVELINGFAAKIGAGVGASRAAVEAGYVANDCQVGQTGKIVAPELYIAVGISGAVQHIAGMKDSKVVVAINSDSNAQIFEYSDYGFVGDLFEVLPKLISNV